MKKLSKIQASILIITIFFATASFAAMTTDLSYWYSGSGQINYWSDTSHKVYYHPYESDMSSSSLSSYIYNGYNAWKSATGYTYTTTSSQSSADIDVMGLTRDSATGAGVPENALAVGFVNSSDRTYKGKGTHYTGTKNIYEVTGKGHLYFVWDSTSENFSVAQWKILFTHELGHVFGYIGHYEANGVMKANLSNIYTSTPSTSNKNHLKQLN